MKRKKINIFESIYGKILIFSIVNILLISAVILSIVIPNINKSMKSLTQSYLYDTAMYYGDVLSDDIEKMGPGGALSTEFLDKSVGAVKMNGIPNSYIYIIDKKGKYVYHPNKDLIGTACQINQVRELADSMAKNQIIDNKADNYLLLETNQHISYYMNARGYFILLLEANEKDIVAPINVTVIKSVVGICIGMVICTIIAIIFSSYLIRPIKEVMESTEQMAQLNFAKNNELNRISRKKDETGAMALAIIQLQQNLIKFISEILGQEEELYQLSKNLENQMEHIMKEVLAVKESAKNISKGAEIQATDSTSASISVIEIGEMISTETIQNRSLYENALTMQQTGEQALHILKQLHSINEKTRASVNEIYDQTSATNDSVLKIREAIESITRIADETKLLSLNASIEAARTGESGRGFVVVARHIQILASQSNLSAVKINAIAKKMITESEQAVRIMDDVKKNMIQQNQYMDSTEHIFVDVKERIDYSIDGIKKVSLMSEEIDTKRTQATQSVERLSSVADENAVAAQSTTGSVLEVTQMVEDILKESNKIRKISENLDCNIKKFKLS